MSPKVEIKVMADGATFLDGRPASLAAIDDRLTDLAKANGVVWYYREAGKAEPPPIAMQVIELVMKHRRLAISLSSKEDFSDFVDDKSISRPR